MGENTENLETVTHKLYNYCLQLTNSKWHAEDLVQDTLYKYIKLKKEEPHREFNLTYLYTMARNLMIDEKRKTKEVFIDYDEWIISDHGFSEWESLLELLYTTLPLRQAMIVTLKDVFKYKSEEIAEMLRVSNESIKTALHRARIKLKLNHNEQSAVPNESMLIKKFSDAVKHEQPHKLFYYYRLLETQNYEVKSKRNQGVQTFFISDPDGNVLQIHHKRPS
ncbi:RNA polymerase sigma factor [Aquisalibacillus elongatus]|uniref:RNA polymerase sigma factor (Sigma-70 family) n=1 Tax=Aquisalibacillus elongatus TaxID=485577 RepID=A0A3N5BX22_9BACI|nr:RNA polymerase sigma factor [Aquisalibacillus elongatus]RPF54308.1 RNA polymerase sigma factor (sigma-70 family) [Aquisalibacillus elongatus]